MKATKTIWVGRVMSALAVFPFIFGGIYSALSNDPKMAEGFAHFGWPASMFSVILCLEIGSAVIYMIPATSVLGAILLTGYLGGAIATHLRVGEHAVFLQVILGVLLWGGLYLRDSRLRALIPISKK